MEATLGEGTSLPIRGQVRANTNTHTAHSAYTHLLGVRRTFRPEREKEKK